MLSHTRNRQSLDQSGDGADGEGKAELSLGLTQSHSRHVADEKWHVKSLIRNANWTNKTVYSISIVTYNGIRTTLLYIIRIWYTIIFGYE